ncbi:unnamed protein product [Phytomonas sp. EM1]|nr:unnamed protein product [Phytomonas sp. EM1]|eukprot:CCW64574.1 unnamed protein product [Phytomonas sp. isolate EM1]
MSLPSDRRAVRSPRGPQTAAAMITGLASPDFRGPLNHNTISELQEGFCILTRGQKTNTVSSKDFHAAMASTGMHVSEEELQELLRVVHSDDRTDGLEFAAFVALLTKEVDNQMVREMRSAFHPFDKEREGKISRKRFIEMFASMGARSSAEELDELMVLAECGDDSETVDYVKLCDELQRRLNRM